MVPLIWDNSYSVGVPELDRHHQRLAGLINQLADSLASRVESETVSDILAALSDYTKYHFEYEERMLEDYGYPELQEHQEEHLAFFETIANACYEATRGSLDLSNLLAYLNNWWTDHILRVDFKYRTFFQSCGVN